MGVYKIGVGDWGGENFYPVTQIDDIVSQMKDGGTLSCSDWISLDEMDEMDETTGSIIVCHEMSSKALDEFVAEVRDYAG